MALWLCYNCVGENGVNGKHFESDTPACACGVSWSDPDTKPFLLKCEVIHFDPPHAILKNRGVRKKACDGKAPANEMSSGHPAVVNCPACKQTEVYRTACEKFGEPVPHKEADFQVA